MFTKLKETKSRIQQTANGDQQSARRGAAGFTIIEVMIVLAIAALILLIVLLAVPALQRSARNTQRKNDVSAIDAAVANYISDNNGSLPASTGVSGTDVLVCGTSCTTGNTEDAKVGFYTAANVSITATVPGVFPDTNHVIILTGYTCPTAAGTLPGTTNVNSRTAVALYALENGSGAQINECTEQ